MYTNSNILRVQTIKNNTITDKILIFVIKILFQRHNLFYLFIITENYRRIVRSIWKNAIIQTNFQLMVLDKVLYTFSQCHRITRTTIDNTSNICLSYCFRNLFYQFINIDKIIFCFASSERKQLLSLLICLQ